MLTGALWWLLLGGQTKGTMVGARDRGREYCSVPGWVVGADAGTWPGCSRWILDILKAEPTGLADVEVMIGFGSGVQGEA